MSINYSPNKRVGRPLTFSHQKKAKVLQTLNSSTNSNSDSNSNDNTDLVSGIKQIEIKTHLPAVFEDGQRRSCAQCSTKDKQIRSVFYCECCNVPLCLKKGKNCYKKFHTQTVETTLLL